MSRRYLTPHEAQAALRRGKEVEIFLGECPRSGKRGIRYAAIRADGDGVRVLIYEKEDYGDPEFLDVYVFGELDDGLHQGDACAEYSFSDLTRGLNELDERWPGASARLVNQGVVVDEYGDYLRDRRS